MDYLIDPYRFKATVKLASFLYPIMNIEYLNVTHAFTAGAMFSWVPGKIDITHACIGGALELPLKTYGLWPVEKLDISHASVAGALVVVLKTYSMLVESTDITHAFVAGELVVVLKTYSNWPVEKLDITHAAVAGVLT